ncbi:hypothetical protein RJ639_013650 [Escallonia herrerae]|uniref:BZIP domain-containing protein n=1 Tax=Escallonia herrerae TaxID=1293975 RepID=A0AA89ALQ0_9ASTE|nr:hypothetical protein RJ639_013650 [Escallonia herrerae]
MPSRMHRPARPAASSSSAYDHGGGGGGGGSSSPPNSWRHTTAHDDQKEESDEDLFTVPDVEARVLPQVTDSAKNTSELQQITPSRRRGRNPVDREYRKLKRLLRNRVSAQQARERKKVYVSDLESRANELHDRNSTLEEKISTLINENTMLRKVLLNTRPKVDESKEPTQ